MTGAQSDPDTADHGHGGVLRPAMRALVFIIVWPVSIFALQSLFGALVCGRHPLPLCFSNQFGFAAAATDCAATLAIVFGFRRFLDRKPASTLGLSFAAPWPWLLAIGAAFGAGMQTLVFGLEVASGSVRVEAVAPLRIDVATCLAVLPLLIVVALGEELPVRGYIFHNLRSAWGDRLALLASSIFFGLLHVANPGAQAHVWLTLAGVVAAGAWFCLSVIWTRSLWLALGAHIAWNLFEGPVFGFPVSGLSFGSTDAITSLVTGPAWWTGGPFGPEAGVSALVALAVGAAVLYVLHRRALIARPFHN